MTPGKTVKNAKGDGRLGGVTVSASQTLRTSPGSYAALCGALSVPAIAVALSPGRLDLIAMIVTTALPTTAAIWLAYLRLRIDDWGIEYRDLFGRNFRVAYSEIAFLKSIYTARGFSYECIHLHDGRRLRLNLKPFPWGTYALLSRRIRCQ